MISICHKSESELYTREIYAKEGNSQLWSKWPGAWVIAEQEVATQTSAFIQFSGHLKSTVDQPNGDGVVVTENMEDKAEQLKAGLEDQGSEDSSS
jgi:hypothetical protein